MLARYMTAGEDGSSRSRKMPGPRKVRMPIGPRTRSMSPRVRRAAILSGKRAPTGKATTRQVIRSVIAPLLPLDKRRSTRAPLAAVQFNWRNPLGLPSLTFPVVALFL